MPLKPINIFKLYNLLRLFHFNNITNIKIWVTLTKNMFQVPIQSPGENMVQTKDLSSLSKMDIKEIVYVFEQMQREMFDDVY